MVCTHRILSVYVWPRTSALNAPPLSPGARPTYSRCMRAFIFGLLVVSSPLAHADEAAPLPWSAELGAGLGFCGARGAITCEGACPGLNLDLRAGKRLIDGLGISVGVTHLSLPVDGFDSASLWILGPEISGHVDVGAQVELLGGLRLGVHHVAGVFGGGWGLGTLDLRLGGRYLFGAGWQASAARRWALGLDYALTRPARTEVCEGGACADADLALMHRLGLVVGLRFW